RATKALDLAAELPDGTQLTGKVDWVNLRDGILHETKYGRACEDAHLWQVRFYLWLLKRCEVRRPDGQPFTGMLNYPKIRRTEPVSLQPEHESALLAQVEELQQQLHHDLPPPRISRRTFCRKCAFEEMCYG
ncbi:MAG: Dna2/Cas4 domain-containing protein, partial [Bacteroidota bacterium]